MSVQYDPTFPQEREDFEFHDREAIVRFAPFSRNQDGDLVVKEQPEFQFYKENDQWYRRGATRDEGATAIEESEVVYWPTIFYQFEIVAYKESDGRPGQEYVGKHLPYRSKLKGIKTHQDPDGKWTFKLPGLGLRDSKFRTGLFVVAEKCGFDIQAWNPDSSLYSSEHIAQAVEELEAPLTSEQIVEKVVERELLAAADAGLLLSVYTGERSNWVQYGSITPLTPEQAERYHQAQADGLTKAEELRNTLRGMAKNASPDFAVQVYKLALQVQSDVDKDNVLASSTAATLEFVVGQLSEPGEPSL